MAEERPFEVVDKRRVRADTDADASPGAAPGNPDLDEELDDEDLLSEEDLADRVAGGGPRTPLELTVGHIIRMNIGLLADKTWISLGLMPDPATGKVEPQLPEARRAIDVIADLVRHAQADAPPEELRELQRMLNDLRVNYVSRSSPGS